MDQDGPFSTFPGMARILTVIEGVGIRLTSNAERLEATHCKPCAFSGDTAFDSHLIDGPIRNFNLIYDPEFVQASVQLITDAADLGDDLINDGNGALYCVAGSLTLSKTTLPQGHVALFETQPDLPVAMSDAAKALLVTLRS